jgi:hypothetical protein
MEKPIEEDKIAETRQQVTDKTVYVQRRCAILLEDTLKGYEEVSHQSSSRVRSRLTWTSK